MLKEEKNVTFRHTDATIAQARNEYFIERGIYSQGTRDLTDEHRATLAAFDAYIRERAYLMFQPNGEANDLPANFFDNVVFHLVDSNTKNAFYMSHYSDKDENGQPFHHIALNRGLLNKAKNEDEIMGIVAHEIGHVIQKVTGLTFNFQHTEIDADCYAVKHMGNAGYNPVSFRSAFEDAVKKQNEQRLKKDEVQLDYVGEVHPNPEERIGHINKAFGLYSKDMVMTEIGRTKKLTQLDAAIKRVEAITASFGDAAFKIDITTTPEIRQKQLNAWLAEHPFDKAVELQESLREMEAFRATCPYIFTENNVLSIIQNGFPFKKDLLSAINDIPSLNTPFNAITQTPEFQAQSLTEQLEGLFHFVDTRILTIAGEPDAKISRYSSRDNLYSDEQDSTQRSAFDRILTNLNLLEEKTPKEVAALPYAEEKYGVCHILNKRDNLNVRHFFEQLNAEGNWSKAGLEAAIQKTFDHIRQSCGGQLPTFHNGTVIESTFRDDLKFKCMVLSSLYQKYYNLLKEKGNEADFNSLGALPPEFREIADKLQLDNLQTQGTDALRQAPATRTDWDDSVQTFKQQIVFLQTMFKGNTKDIIATLMKPTLPEIRVGEKFPFADLIQTAQTYYKETRKRDSFAHRILATLGVMDERIFPNNEMVFPSNKRKRMTLLWDRDEPNSYDSIPLDSSKFTDDAIDKYADYRIGYIDNPKTGTKTLYTYDAKTFEVLSVDIHKESVDGSFNNPLSAQTSNLAMYIFNKSTAYENTRYHYLLKEHFANLKSMPNDVKRLEEAVILTQSVRQFNYSLPYKPAEIHWDISLNNSEKMVFDPDEQQRILAEKPHLFTPNECPFAFLTQTETENQLMQTFLDLGHAAKTDPELAQALIDTREFWDLSWYWGNGSSIFRETEKEKYRNEYFELLSSEPFISHAEKFRPVLDAEYDLLMHLHKKFPILFKHAYNIPGETAEIPFDLTPFETNKENLKQDEITHNSFFERGTLRFVDSLKDHLENGNRNIPVDFMFHRFDSGSHSRTALWEIVAKRENWPADLRTALSLLRHNLTNIRLELLTNEQNQYEIVNHAVIMDEYLDEILNETDWDARREKLKWFWDDGVARTSGNKNFRIPNAVKNKFFGWSPDNPGIWTGDLKEQIKTYQFLSFTQAFAFDAIMETKVLSHLLDEIENIPSLETREEYVFALMGQRNPILSSVLEERARNMWIDTVLDLLGHEKDNNSPEYAQKWQPYIDKLYMIKPGLRVVNDDGTTSSLSFWDEDDEDSKHQTVCFDAETFCSVLPYTTVKRISHTLQERTLSQVDLSYKLAGFEKKEEAIQATIDFINSEEGQKIKQKAKRKITDADIKFAVNVFECVKENCKHQSHFAVELVDFLLTQATPTDCQNIQNTFKNLEQFELSFEILKKLKKHGVSSSQKFQKTPMPWEVLHQHFWDIPQTARAVILLDLLKLAHSKEKLKDVNDKICEDLLDRIFAKYPEPNFNLDIDEDVKHTLTELGISLEKIKDEYVTDANRIKQSYRDNLKIYVTSTNEGQEESGLGLLCGSLTASKPKPGVQELSQAKMIRLLLESQGPAGIKVGQFMALQDGIGEELREELKELTYNAQTPSRAEIFKIIENNHPELFATFKQHENTLGPVIGAASLYMTMVMNADEIENAKHVLSILKEGAGSEAKIKYDQMLRSCDASIKFQRKILDNANSQADQKHAQKTLEIMHIIRSSVRYVESMNDTEVDANEGYKQVLEAQRQYDGVQMTIDGFDITFKTMGWLPPEKSADKTYTTTTTTNANQSHEKSSYKIQEAASGVDFPKWDGGKAKIAVAKANIMLNLRSILMGGLFDDDRHQGQFKVDISRLNDGKIHLNLFDTGSMSLKKPTQEERQYLGKVLQGVIHASISNPHKTFATLLHEEVAKIASKTGGTEPLYISKVERALANLTHFTAEIPEESRSGTMIGLLLQVVNNPDLVHKDILDGMKQNTTPLYQTVISMITSKDIQQTLTKKVKAGDVKADLDALFSLPELSDSSTPNEAQAQKDKALETLVDIIDIPMEQINEAVAHQKKIITKDLVTAAIKKNNGKLTKEDLDTINAQVQKYTQQLNRAAIINHINTQLGKLDAKTAQVLTKHVFRLMQTFIQASNTYGQKTPFVLRKEIISYLRKTGLPRPILNAICKKMKKHEKQLPLLSSERLELFQKRFALTMLNIGGGKLRFWEKEATQIIDNRLADGLKTLLQYTAPLSKELATAQMSVTKTENCDVDIFQINVPKPKEINKTATDVSKQSRTILNFINGCRG